MSSGRRIESSRARLPVSKSCIISVRERLEGIRRGRAYEVQSDAGCADRDRHDVLEVVLDPVPISPQISSDPQKGGCGHWEITQRIGGHLGFISVRDRFLEHLAIPPDERVRAESENALEHEKWI